LIRIATKQPKDPKEKYTLNLKHIYDQLDKDTVIQHKRRLVVTAELVQRFAAKINRMLSW